MVPGSGVARRQVTLFASPNKVTKQRRPRSVCDHALRSRQPAVLGFGGVKKNSPAAQTVFCPDPPNPPLLGAFTRGQTGAGSGAGNVPSLSLGVGAGTPSPRPSPAQRAREQDEADHLSPQKTAGRSKWPTEQAGLEAVGKRAVEPANTGMKTRTQIKEPRASEASP